MAKRKRTNNDLLNITHKTKYRVTGTPLKTGNNNKFYSNGHITENNNNLQLKWPQDRIITMSSTQKSHGRKLHQ